MPPTPAESSLLRSAAVINEEIRQLIAEGGLGSGRYQELLVEWAEAWRREGRRGDVSPAA